MPSSGWMRRISAFGLEPPRELAGEGEVRRPLEHHHDLGGPLGQAFAGTDVHGHAGPAPVVDREPHGDERLGHRLRVHALLLAVAGNALAVDRAGRVLGAHDPGADLVDGGAMIERSSLTFSSRIEVGVHAWPAAPSR